MTQQFMRPAFITQDQINNVQGNTGQLARAHCELYVPIDSTHRARLNKMWVSCSDGFTVCLRGGPMMTGASFGESRGLPLIDGAQRPYSSAHARNEIKVGPEYDGGQIWNNENLGGKLVELEFPILLGQGNSLFVRSTLYGKPLFVTFLWTEEPI